MEHVKSNIKGCFRDEDFNPTSLTNYVLVNFINFFSLRLDSCPKNDVESLKTKRGLFRQLKLHPSINN